MTESPRTLEPLSPALQNLIAEARFEDGPDAQTRDRLYHRLAGTLALPLLPQAATGSGAAAAKTATALLGGKSIALIAALSVGIGLLGTGGWYVFQRNGDKNDTNPVENVAFVPPPSPAADADTDTDTAGTEAEGGTDAGRNTASITATPSPADDDGPKKTGKRLSDKESMAGERLLIESARDALRKGYAEDSLHILKQHKKRFPEGRFEEERDALQIMALSKHGRDKEARKLGVRFIENYPQSMFIDAVNAALSKRK